MKKILYLMAAAALVFAACDKGGEDSPKPSKVSADDFVGSWVNTNEGSGDVFDFRRDGTFTQSWPALGDEHLDGSWKLQDGKLILTVGDEAPFKYDFSFMSGKNAIAVIAQPDEADEIKYASHTLLYKEGATVKSPALTDGRWTAPHDGIRPAKYDRANDYTFDLEISGTTAKFVVHAWGMIIECPFTQENGKIKLNFTDSNIKQGAWWDSAAQGWFWFMGGAPDGFEAGYDDSYASMDSETYALQAPYSYQDGDIMNQARVFQEMYLMVDDNGKDAYLTAVGTTKWLFKR